MPEWVSLACRDYMKRMPKEMHIEIIELKPLNYSQRDVEADRILKNVGKDALIALDRNGESVNTFSIVNKINLFRNNNTGHRNIAFAIGGADGLDARVKDKAHLVWKLSDLTLTHGIARLLLIEQLYRAYTVLSQHPYHRD